MPGKKTKGAKRIGAIRAIRRKPYRFSIDMEKHGTLVEFLDDIPPNMRGKCIIDALRLYLDKFLVGNTAKEEDAGQRIDMTKILGK